MVTTKQLNVRLHLDEIQFLEQIAAQARPAATPTAVCRMILEDAVSGRLEVPSPQAKKNDGRLVSIKMTPSKYDLVAAAAGSMPVGDFIHRAIAAYKALQETKPEPDATRALPKSPGIHPEPLPKSPLDAFTSP